jgi:starch synthase
MFSQRYGTIPVVRRTGGLADSVLPFDADTGEGTGVVFDHYSARALRWALDRALGLYGQPEAWRRLVDNAMAADHSWERRARRYVEIYRWLADERRA